jgi:hypothetical protein
MVKLRTRNGLVTALTTGDGRAKHKSQYDGNYYFHNDFI